MAYSSPSILSTSHSTFSSKSATPMAFSYSPSKPLTRTIAVLRSFHGLRKIFQPSSTRLVSAPRSHRRSFRVNAVKLSDYIGKKYVILFFYPLDFTFVCPTEITAFSDRYAEFEKLNTEVLGVSIDSVFSHLAWVQTDRKSGGLGDLKYPLVSDVTKSIAKSYEVLISDQGIALRGLFIIDKEGIIQHSTINNLAIGRSVDETLRTLQALQYVQENPDEVCPAGWKPGDKSMKPDPKRSKEYFAAI
ncbi:hypothetical protein KFK09_000641 [Dendrobium nobile]|uniref:2-Cys peroxiredoxin BAS1, chloroplastic n=1 Tax=Dendrobium nobile TaxID=94219 RepID=A0A8T3CEH7_DENNO|nr:hypothetical protein KFK09_000641 [Dendrobium nobile]